MPRYAGAFDAEVIAIHVIDAFVYIGNRELPMRPLSPAQHEELQDLVTRDWCKPLADASLPYRAVLMDGNPAFAIMHVAETENAELVVTGRRGRGGFAALVLGSTSHQLTHHLDRPLVIVP